MTYVVVGLVVLRTGFINKTEADKWSADWTETTGNPHLYAIPSEPGKTFGEIYRDLPKYITLPIMIMGKGGRRVY